MKKLVLISGASGGLGEACAVLFAQAGYRVALSARRADRLASVVENIRAGGGEAMAFPCDLSVESERADLVRKIGETWGPVDVLVNNAGSGWYGLLSEMPDDVAMGILRINVEAVTSLVLKILPGMTQRRQGLIINIGSVVGTFDAPGTAVYSSSKAWIDSFSRALYRETRGTGVDVCLVRPGPIATGFFDAALAAKNGSPIPAQSGAISAERVARLVLKLAKHPRRAVWIPWWYRFLGLVDPLFGGIVDLMGQRAILK